MSDLKELEQQIAIAQQNQNWAEVVRLCSIYLEKEKNNYLVYGIRGVAHRALGNFEDAIKDLNETSRLNPKDAGAYNNRADVYNAMGRHDEAIVECNAAIKIDPGMATAYYHRANALLAQEKYDAAVKDYDAAIQLNPSLSSAHYGRGFVYMAQGKFEKAIAKFNEAINLNDERGYMFNMRGVAYGQLGKYDEAIADFYRAIELSPDEIMVYKNLCIAYENKNKLEAKIKAYVDKEEKAKKYRNAILAIILVFSLSVCGAMIYIFMKALFMPENSMPSYNMLPFLLWIALILAPLWYSVHVAQIECARYAREGDALDTGVARKELNMPLADYYVGKDNAPTFIYNVSDTVNPLNKTTKTD